MASSRESAFFPTLEKCLNEDHQLLSWKQTFRGLSSNSPSIIKSHRLRDHLCDKESLSTLTQCLSSSPPSTQSKSSFETRTSAINITPTTKGRYDIKQIKEDTLWLSKEVKVDEVSSLRIAVLEYQTRGAIQLLSEPIEAQPDISLHNGFTSSFSKAKLPTSSRISASDQASQAFHSDARRRYRLLQIFLEERLYVLRVTHLLLCTTPTDVPSLGKGRSSARATTEAQWKTNICQQIRDAWGVLGETSKRKSNWVEKGVTALSSRLEALFELNSSLEDVASKAELEIIWCQNHLLEMILISQILLECVRFTRLELPKSHSISSWFGFMKQYDFFESSELPFPETTAIYFPSFQANVAVLSLAILKLPRTLLALEAIFQEPATAPERTPDAVYIRNPDTILEIGMTLLDAATTRSRNASLAIFAWSLVQQYLRESANESKETREVNQGQRAADNYAIGGPDHSLADSSARSGQTPLTRRSSTSSDTSQQIPYLEMVLEEINSCSTEDDVVAFQANVAVNEMGVFEMIAVLALERSMGFANGPYWRAVAERRVFLLDLVQAAAERIDYDEDFFLAITTITSPPQSSWDSSAYFQCDGKSSIAAQFLQSEALMSKAFRGSQYRFPYESLPFLTLCGGLSMCGSLTTDKISPLKALLEDLPTFTAELSPHAETQEARDQHDIPCRKLVVGQDMFPGRRSQFTYSRKLRIGLSPSSALSVPDQFQLPPETLGTILSTRNPPVIAWHHSYSALKYLGKAVQHSLVTKALSDAQTAFHATQAVSETVRILTNMLRTTCELNNDKVLHCIDQDAAQALLDEASDGLGGSEDIMTVILALFEEQLYKSRNPITAEVSADLLSQCILFLHTMLAIRPGRVWPFLAKSGFLGLVDGESQLSTIINAPEISPSEHLVIEGVVCFFNAAVEDSVAHTVSRRLRKPHDKPGARFQSQDVSGSGISHALVNRIILRLEQITLGVLATSQNWKAVPLDQKAALHGQICTSLTKVLKYRYEIGEDLEISSEAPKSDLAQAAAYLIEVLLSDSAITLMVQPLLQSLVECHHVLESNTDFHLYDILVAQSQATLNLFSTLTQVNEYLGFPPSVLPKKLFDLVPLLIKIYVLHDTFRLPVLNLMQSLVKLFGRQQDSPRSLLSCLGRTMTTHVLELLSHLSVPLEDEEVSISIWRFFSVVISNTQQGLSAYLLTSEEPREALKRGESHRAPKRDVPSVLQIAISRLCSLDSLPPSEAVYTLEFIVCAADCSPWVAAEVQGNQELLSEFHKHLTAHDSHPQTIRKISLIAGILAICVNDSYSRGDTTFAKKLAPKLSYFMKHGASAPPYNVSLQTKLNENIQKLFTPFRLADFQWTSMCEHPLGNDYYYSLEATDKMLGFSPKWIGPNGKGFAAEVSTANINLSLVEAHSDLFNRWSWLVLELSHALEDDTDFHKSLVNVIRDCLSTDSFSFLPEPLFSKVVESRLKLALPLLQRIVRVLPSSVESQELLKPAWQAACNFMSESREHIAVSKAESGSVLLRILLYTLQPHIQGPSNVDLSKSAYSRSSATSESAMVALEILDVVVAQGFRSITTVLHDDPTKVLPSDFMILTAILEVALAVPGVDQHPVQLTSCFTDEHTIRYASTLLSWSDRLQIDNDPVYGELSIQFLLALSAMPPLAESLAVEGVLTQIASTNLIKYFMLPGGKGALDEPVRMHAIWSRVILPLVLNLLQLVGAPIAGEVVGFLNEFHNQMNRGSSTTRRVKPPAGRTSLTASTWTLNDAAELQSLALITMITDAFRDAGASAGIVSSDVGALAWDKAEAKEDIEYWLRSRNALRESIRPLTEQEAVWATQKAASSASGAETRLEEMVVEEMSAALGFLGGSEES